MINSTNNKVTPKTHAMDLFSINQFWSEKELKDCNSADPKEVKRLIDNLRLKKKKDDLTTDIGNRLEELANYLIKTSGLFLSPRNGFSTTFCQIDHWAKFHPAAWATFFGAWERIREQSQIMAGESKNYDAALGVTYVLKFECIKLLKKFPIGIYFTVEGLTGSEDTIGLKASKSAVIHTFEAFNSFSVVFANDDWDRLYDQPKEFGIILSEKFEEFLTAEKI